MTPMDTDQMMQCVDSSVASVSSVTSPMPLPYVPITVRAGTLADLPFIDALQKRHSKAVGWMPTKSLEGKIALGQVLVAEESGQWAVGSEQLNPEDCASSSSFLPTAHCPPPTPVGYCIAADRYFKRDDVGIIYQMNVVPGRQRGLIGATLLKAQFERSAYGCRLYCCWCAQDLAANQFWEAMGFTALAFRSGGRKSGVGGRTSASSGSTHDGRPTTHGARTHIFWQKRIRAGDTGDVARGGTPWWFPSQTTGGSICEDRIVLPIPPGMHWTDAKPIVLPGVVDGGQSSVGSDEMKKLPSRRTSAALSLPSAEGPRLTMPGGLFFGAAPTVAPVKEKATRAPRVKAKNDPALVAAARELRDRWLEQVNADAIALPTGKYDVSKTIDGAQAGARQIDALPFSESRLLPAA